MSRMPERLRIPPTDAGLRELMAAGDIAHAFLTAERAEDVYQLALDRVSPLVGATLACVYLIDAGSDLMRLAAVHNWPERYSRFLGEMRVRVGQGPSGLAAGERRAIEVPDVATDPSLAHWRDAANELGFRSVVALPLETSTGVLGAVTFYFESPNAVTAETRHLMRMVADQTAATAEKSGLIESLRSANAALTESKAALERQYADALEARRVKDEFLANISHELRTPLTAVIGYIALLQEGLGGPITPEQHETLEHVKGSSERLLALIGDLLELTALKRGDVRAAANDIDPRDPLRDAVAAARGRRDGVELEVSQPEIVPTVRMDRRTVAKILTLMLDNAFKFTRAGDVRAVLQIDRDRVMYSVSDTGIGIPAQSHETVFEEFRQVDGTMTREFGGSGLGLALARRLASLVEGEITLESVPGTGSMFQLSLPLRHGGD